MNFFVLAMCDECEETLEFNVDTEDIRSVNALVVNLTTHLCEEEEEEDESVTLDVQNDIHGQKSSL